MMFGGGEAGGFPLCVTEGQGNEGLCVKALV